MKVVEHFASVQGEGAFIGLPTFFIRLPGCNLRCKYCDTAYAQEPERVLSTNLFQVAQVVAQSGIQRVTITGGEPLLHAETVERLLRLLMPFVSPLVSIETNGTCRPTEGLLENVSHWTLSPKLANAGIEYPWEDFAVTLNTLAVRRQGTVEFKLVVDGPDDLRHDSFFEFMERTHLWHKKGCILTIQPNGRCFATGGYEAYFESYTAILGRVLTLTKLRALFDIRVLPQLHLLAWKGEQGK